MVISTLTRGGSKRHLVALLTGSARRGYEAEVFELFRFRQAKRASKPTWRRSERTMQNGCPMMAVARFFCRSTPAIVTSGC